MADLEFPEYTKFVVLAQALEPLIEKDYCATPTKSLGPGKTFIDFVISGVNTMPQFLELEKRVINSGGQPPVFYDLVYKAVAASEHNRNWKTINLGPMEALFPTMVARMLTTDSKSAMKKVGEILKNTSKEDVLWEQKTRSFAWGKSGKPAKRDFPIVDAENVYDYYKKIIPIIEERGLRNHHFYNELLNGLPMSKRMLVEIEKNPETPIFDTLSRVHNELIREKHLEKSPGIIADYVGVALFLYLTDHPNEKITWV